MLAIQTQKTPRQSLCAREARLGFTTTPQSLNPRLHLWKARMGLVLVCTGVGAGLGAAAGAATGWILHSQRRGKAAIDAFDPLAAEVAALEQPPDLDMFNAGEGITACAAACRRSRVVPRGAPDSDGLDSRACMQPGGVYGCRCMRTSLRRTHTTSALPHSFFAAELDMDLEAMDMEAALEEELLEGLAGGVGRRLGHQAPPRRVATPHSPHHQPGAGFPSTNPAPPPVSPCPLRRPPSLPAPSFRGSLTPA